MKISTSVLILFVAFLFMSMSPLAADVAGTWDLTATTASGEVLELVLILSETDGNLSGTLGTYEGSVPIENVKLEDNKLTFQVTTPEGVTYKSALDVSGDQMKGGYSGDDGSSGTLSATRSK